jgi:hypothetical protein
MRSLRRLCRITFLATALLLAMLVLTGFQQNSLINSYNTIVEESEKTIFLYATIREQSTEGLLSRDSSLLLASAKEFEKLNGIYTSMLDNHLIPSQYKLTFLKDLDLELVVVSLKNLAAKPDNEELKLKILNQLRQINNQFLQFDRIVIGEMKTRVMRHQKNALILMGFVVALTCFSLIILYQKSVTPLLQLADQAAQAQADGEFITLTAGKNSSVEISELISSFNQLLNSREKNIPSTLPDKGREAAFSAMVNEVVNGLNGIINYSQLLTDYCEAEQIGDEQKEVLSKIIKTAEKSAAILQKGQH